MDTQKVAALWIGSDKGVAEKFERQLKDIGSGLLSIVRVNNVKEALEKLDTQSFDAAFVDSKGPWQGDQWWNAFAHLGQITPIVIVTRGDDEDFVFSALKRGAVDFIHSGDLSGHSLLKTLRHSLVNFSLRRELSQSKKSEGALKLLVSQVSGFVWATDLKMVCNFLEGTHLEKLGFSKEEILAHPFGELMEDDEQKTKWIRAHERAFNGESNATGISIGSHNFNLHLEPLRNDQGEIVGAVGTAMDVTQRAAFESQFLAAQKMESVGRLALGVAHDFNNLLTVILNYSQMVLVKAKDDETLRNRMEAISNCAHRAASITSQFLAFGRRNRPKPQGVSVSSVLSIVEPMLRQGLGSLIDLQIREEEHGLKVFMDPNHLMHIVMSMVQSGQDSMPDGGRLTINSRSQVVDEKKSGELGGITPGDYVVITVTDTGRGFDAESAEHIFELFGGEKSEGGAPVSLSAINGMVKHASGHIAVHSEVGKGSRFDIYLPRHMEVASMATEPKKDVEEEKSLETILVVDDEELVRRIAVDVMKQNGYNVLEAPSAIEALKLCEQRPGKVDLVLTDLVMPKMNGPELVRKMAAKHPHIRVVYMSGYTDDAVDHIEALEAKESFVQKPFLPKSLLGAVKDALNRPTSLSQ